jgi:hypothetical protein
MTDAVAVEIIRAIPETIGAVFAGVAMMLGFHNKKVGQNTNETVQKVKEQSDGLVNKLIEAKDEKSALAVEGAHAQGMKDAQDE